MALLNRKVDYALLILCELYQRPGGACARAAAERFGLSRPFVANILKCLCSKGFVKSHRGLKGGYVPDRPAAEVRLIEVMEALDTPFELAACCSEDPQACGLMGLCPVRKAIAELDRRVRAVLESVTLADLFGTCATQFGLEVNLAPCLAGGGR
jgi:Rrf2 family protein